jgi:small ubiquitin-related modifier
VSNKYLFLVLTLQFQFRELQEKKEALRNSVSRLETTSTLTTPTSPSHRRLFKRFATTSNNNNNNIFNGDEEISLLSEMADFSELETNLITSSRHNRNDDMEQHQQSSPSLLLNLKCTFFPQPIKLRLYYNDRFQKLKQLFSRSLDVPESQIVLKYDGITLNPLHTPTHFHMQDEDTIVASLLPISGHSGDKSSSNSNTNTSTSAKTKIDKLTSVSPSSTSTKNISNTLVNMGDEEVSSATLLAYPSLDVEGEEQTLNSESIPLTESSIESLQPSLSEHNIENNNDTSMDHHNKESINSAKQSQETQQQQQQAIVIKVLIEGEHKPLQFRIRYRDPLSKVMNAVCERRGIKNDQLRLTFDGVVVLPHQSPQDLDMEDEDLLDAVIVPSSSSSSSSSS